MPLTIATSQFLRYSSRRSLQSHYSFVNEQALLPRFRGRTSLSSAALSQSRSLSTTTPNSTTDLFLSAIKARRSHHKVAKSSPISDDRIEHIINETVLHCPSSFNSQSTRVVLLLGAQHDKLWEDIVKPAVKAAAPPEAWEQTELKLDGFKNGYGTVLLYENFDDIVALQKKFPLYADKFLQWSEHTNAMHTYILWTAFHAEGLGASLQHYNPLIDQFIASEWDIKSQWRLKGQLVFGAPIGEPKEKSFKPLKERVFVHS